MRCPTIVLLALGCTTVSSTQRSLNVRVSTHPAVIFGLEARQTGSCSSGESSCGDSCIPTSASCCSASEGTFCPSGYRCDSDGCCEIGEICSGPGIGCPDGTERCGLECVLEGDCPGGGSGSGSGTSTTTPTTGSSTRTTSTPTSTAMSNSGSNANSTNDGLGMVPPVGGVLLAGLLGAVLGM